MPGVYLFSVDLEDVRSLIPDGRKYKEAVPRCTRLYLDWLDEIQSKATFFVVGETADSYPDLIREIYERGHELACHTYAHGLIFEQTPEGFEADLIRNKEAILKTVDVPLRGFRAPMHSLIERTKWVYPVLKNHGFVYSSSVVPSDYPFPGWPGFYEAQWQEGIYEMPLQVASRFLKIPFGGGVYFRLLPLWLNAWLMNARKDANGSVISYFHPYDVDTEQEPFMHPNLNNSAFLNRLMYINRSRVIDRLHQLVRKGWIVQPYSTFLQQSNIIQ